jgi:hypothetical protein
MYINVDGVKNTINFPYLDYLGPKYPFQTLTRIKKFWEQTLKKSLHAQDL